MKKKRATLKIKEDPSTAGSPLRVYLYAGNGHELFRSSDTVAKKTHGERTILRIAAAMEDAVSARLEEPDQ